MKQLSSQQTAAIEPMIYEYLASCLFKAKLSSWTYFWSFCLILRLLHFWRLWGDTSACVWDEMW